MTHDVRSHSILDAPGISGTTMMASSSTEVYP